MVDAHIATTRPTHPRRCSAMLSVSLPPVKRQKLDHSSNGSESAHDLDNNLKAYPPSILISMRNDDVQTSDRGAQKWFDDVNENVRDTLQSSTRYDSTYTLLRLFLEPAKPLQMIPPSSSAITFKMRTQSVRILTCYSRLTLGPALGKIVRTRIFVVS